MTRAKSGVGKLKLACYSVNITMAAVSNLSPVLFLTFRSMYGISYTLLGMLVLVNYVTQLIIDLIFSFFSHRFNIPRTVKSIPLIAVCGFMIYALAPIIFPDAVFVGLVIGTAIFSAASGLGEVLISPVFAAIPSDDPDREMSKLHSLYAWGVVMVITVSTVFLLVFGGERWQLLAGFFAVLPMISAVLFFGSEIPKMETPERASGAIGMLKNPGVWLSVFAIFLGGAAECTMAQWASGYIERALGLPKLWGDLLGVAMFGLTLGIGRTMYARLGKNIGRVLTLGAVGAVLCYLTAALTDVAWLGLIACGFTGFFVSMLWPGNLVVASSRFPKGGVFIFAMMAAGGDLGASVGPQLVGIITDAVIASPIAAELATSLSLAPDQLGMKLGLLCGMLFPLIGVVVYALIWRGEIRRTSADVAADKK